MNHQSLWSRRQFLAALASSSSLAGLPKVQAQPASAEVEVKEERTVVDIKVGGKPFAVYNFHPDHGAIYRPFFHPVMGPNDRPITQQGEFPGSMRGHYWHRALFIAHQRVNGISFWEERKADCGRIVHLAFDRLTSGREGIMAERLAWRNLEGGDVLRENRVVRVPAAPASCRLLDIALTLTAAKGPVTFAATPYNLLACRVIDAMCLLAQKERYTKQFGTLVNFAPLNEGGQIINSEGRENEACRGARARWCDFSGPLGDGSWGGVAILDHPSNPRHPTPWHNWNNMTITASFTFHEPYTLQEGQQLSLAYRLAVHAGDARKADVESLWKDFARIQPVKS